MLKAAPNTSNQVFAKPHQVDIVNFFSKLLPIGGPAEGRGREEGGEGGGTVHWIQDNFVKKK